MRSIFSMYSRARRRSSRAAARCLMGRGQTGNEAMQPLDVIDEPQRSVRMHHRIIPGRNHLCRLQLRRIKRRRDISVRSLKDRQRLLRLGDIRATRDWRALYDLAGTQRSGLGQRLHRHMVGDESRIRGHDQSGEGLLRISACSTSTRVSLKCAGRYKAILDRSDRSGGRDSSVLILKRKLRVRCACRYSASAASQSSTSWPGSKPRLSARK